MKFYTVLLAFFNINIAVFNLSAQDVVNYLANNDSPISVKKNINNPLYEYKVYYYKNQLNNITQEEAGEHFLGEMIAKKLYLLDKKYMFSSYLGAGSSKTKISIHKPIIYEAVKDIEFYMIRMIKKGKMFDLVAEENLNIILDVAINIITQETSVFESELELCRSIKDKIALFTERVKLINI